MFMDLFQQLQKPETFKRPEKMFWQDPHIARYLLEAHLSPQTDAASRRPEFLDRSADFIAAAAMKDGGTRIIDYGCGPGLYCERLAQRGFAVTGIDFSEHSIRYARESAQAKQLAITYRYGDYLKLAVEGPYDLAILIYCDYGALGPEDRRQLLHNIRGSLRAGGRLLLDVFTAHRFARLTEESRWSLQPHGGFWSPDAHLELAQSLKYDGYVSLNHTVIVTGQETEAYYIWDQAFTEEMLASELAGAGFELMSFYNDVAGEAYREGHDTLAVLAEKK
ncbi:class I SAM-dependent methyltransferase [Paenibacillus tengchongensis]|uniref:class I SAM-dependent methyltransferase n=1 Tax=Paenibacillus tengchongensis TaxID=2608684 RepID=UPI001FE8B286|nr:class I SAM-dependent methyltransferase [Paenibacillus tengchongensis]